MKSSFLLVGILASLFHVLAWAQTPTTVTTTPEVEKSSFDKFYDRLKIGYFGAAAGSSFDHWDRYTLTEGGVQDHEYVSNIWNQISFNYNFGAKMTFVINPRFSTFLSSTSGHAKGSRSNVVLEDALVGFQGTILQSADKKFALWSRPGLRLPTSQASRAGDITTNLEVLNAYSYDFNPTWQLGMYQQFRHWVYEQRYTSFRYRLFHAPYIQYAINDKHRIAFWYEQYMENRRNSKSQSGTDHRLQDYWQNGMVSWSWDVTPKMNLMPFVGYMLDAKDISNYPIRPMWLGGWISYTIK